MARKTIYKRRNRLNAAILSLFGGAFGLHKFYLRDTGGGIFYLILAFITINSISFPVSAMLGFFDAMKLLMMPDSEFDRKYNRHLLKQNRTYRNSSRSKVVVRKTKRVKNNPFKKSAIKKYKDFALEDALIDFEKAIEIDPNDPDLHFNMACAYSLTEQSNKSFYHIAKAVELGFTDLDKIKTHDDLAFLRIQSDFDSFEKANYSFDSNSIKRNSDSSKNTRNLLDQDVLLSQLNKLKELRDKGVINESDYVTETKKLMNRR